MKYLSFIFSLLFLSTGASAGVIDGSQPAGGGTFNGTTGSFSGGVTADSMTVAGAPGIYMRTNGAPIGWNDGAGNNRQMFSFGSLLDINGGNAYNTRIGNGGGHTYIVNGLTVSSVTVQNDILLKNNKNINWVDSGGTTRNVIWMDTSDLLNFQTGSHMTWNPGFAEYMRLTSAGRLGIGTTIPGTKLHMSSGIYTLDGTTARMNLYAPFNSGWYGYGNANSNKQFAGLYNDADGDGILDLNNLNEVLQVRLHPNGDSYFNGGAVGFGTTSPTAGYDVTVANSAANAIRVNADAGYEINFAGAAAANIYHSQSGQAMYINTNAGDLNLGISDGGAHVSIAGASGAVTISTMAATYVGGSAHVCVTDAGLMFASEAACP